MLQRKQSQRQRRAAFTLMEMLVVVAIIVALAGIGGFFLMAQLSTAKGDLALTHVKGTLTPAVEAYSLRHNGNFPQTLDQLLVKDEFGGPYLKSKDALLDPWKQPYQYDMNGPMNQQMVPDIWTVDPKDQTQKKLGNWPAQTNNNF